MRFTTFLAVLLSGSVLAAPGGAAERLAFGTTNTGSSHYSYAVSLSRSLAAAGAGIDLTIIETGGSVDNVRRMKRGAFDLGITTTDVLHQAHTGTGLFANDAQPDLRILMLYTPAPMVVAVRADSGVAAIADLGGKRFNPGLRGSSSEKTTERILELLGVKPEYYRGSVSDALEATKNRQIVGFVKAGAGVLPDASLMELQAMTKARLLGFTEGEVKRVLEQYPYYSSIVIPAGTYKDQTEPVRTFGFIMALVVRDRLPAEVGYKLVKAFVEQKAIQEASFPGVKGVDYGRLTIEQASIPLHPGSVRYFTEKGLSVPARLTAAQ